MMRLGSWCVVPVLVAGLAGPMGAQVVPWNTTELMRFADAPPDIAFARINEIAVDADGQFYVLDGLNSEIYVFDPDGRHVRTIGRRGAGPGELSAQVSHMAVGGELVAVGDLGNQRVTLFNRAGALQGDFPVRMMETGMVMGLGVLPDGTLLIQRDPLPTPAGFPTSSQRADRPLLLHLDREGAVLDTVFAFSPAPVIEFTGASMRAHFPDAMPVWAVDARGRVVVGQGDRYVLRRWVAGRLVDSLGRDVPRRPMTARFRDETRRQQDSIMEAMSSDRGMPMPTVEMVFPDSFPVLGQVSPGPFGSLLVWRPHGMVDDAEPGSGQQMDVFTAEGAYLGTWDLPGRFRLMTARDDRLYGVETDEDDLPYVVVYRVER